MILFGLSCFLQIGVSVGGHGAAGSWISGAALSSRAHKGLWISTDHQDVSLYNPEGEKPSSALSCLLPRCDIRVTETFQFRNTVGNVIHGISLEL